MTNFAEIWGNGGVRPPAAANPDIEDVHRQRWREAAGRSDDDTLRALADDALSDPSIAPLLAAMFGNSPYLSQCLISDLAFARRLLKDGPDTAFADALAAVVDFPGFAGETTDQVKARLRIAKRVMD